MRLDLSHRVGTRALFLSCVLAFSACGTPGAVSGGSPTPGADTPSPIAATRSPSPTASSSPQRLPGSVVRISVNGIDYPAGAAITDPGTGPITIVLTFPFAVDRASVERWGMSGQPTKTWLDDRTLRLVYADTEPSIGFKIAETLSASGDTAIDFVVVNVTSPGTRTVSVFTVAELAAAGNTLPRTTASWRIRSNDGIALSPDAKRVLIYDGFAPPSGQVPSFIELDTKQSTQLVQPPASDGWFSYADWMGDGRLVMVGRSVWVGDANATNMKRIADATALVGGYPWVGLPDPGETRIALWGYNADGHIAIVDLSSGAVRLVTGPFRRCAADGSTSFAWSADGRLLAGMDCDSEGVPDKARVRIVDVAADRTLRTIEGGGYLITGLPTGNFIFVRESGESGAGARQLGQVFDFGGEERGRYLGRGWRMSPDRRYLLQTGGGPAGGPTYLMIDLVGGTSFEFGVPCGGRSEGGCPSPHWMRDGRLAFY